VSSAGGETTLVSKSKEEMVEAIKKSVITKMDIPID